LLTGQQRPAQIDDGRHGMYHIILYYIILYYIILYHAHCVQH
jgi:hypothetical protein